MAQQDPDPTSHMFSSLLLAFSSPTAHSYLLSNEQGKTEML